ncbi:hypothetical protein P7C70_g1866, partial [Phenoliferia sp. Uapishka_3]
MSFSALHQSTSCSNSSTSSTTLSRVTQPATRLLASFLGIRSVSVNVLIEKEVIHVRPDRVDDEEATLRGVVTIKLPGRRTVRSLGVVLEGTCILYGAEEFEEERSTPLLLRRDLDFGEETLEAGDYSFMFTIDVPSNAASGQRCPFGTIKYYLTATLDLAFDGSTINSDPVRVWIGSPQPGEFLLPSYELSHEHISPDLGPFRAHLFSPHLATASLVQVRLTFASIPKSLNIFAIRMLLDQTFLVHYADPRRPKGPFVDTHALKWVDPSIPSDTSLSNHQVNQKLLIGQEWEYEGIFRVLGENTIRGSTVAPGDNKIEVSHTLSVEIRYRVDGTKALLSTKVSVPVWMDDVRLSLLIPSHQRVLRVGRG